MTFEELERVCGRALKGTSYILRDSALFITEVPNAVHDRVHSKLNCVLSNYADARDLESSLAELHDFPLALEPDVSITSSGERAPVLVAEIEVGHRTVAKLIELARDVYLVNNAVQRVLGVCIFGSRLPARRTGL